MPDRRFPLVMLAGLPPSHGTISTGRQAVMQLPDACQLTNTVPCSPLPAPGLPQMRSATMWLGIAGGVLMAVLLFAGVKGSLVIGILFVTIISW